MSLLLIVNSIFLNSFSGCSASPGADVGKKDQVGVSRKKTEAIKERGQGDTRRRKARNFLREINVKLTLKLSLIHSSGNWF